MKELCKYLCTEYTSTNIITATSFYKILTQRVEFLEQGILIKESNKEIFISYQAILEIKAETSMSNKK